ncbi:hypothetical protein XAUC_04060 [Xanthomonas citri pv. aurantifolii str. ICPB 10535]|nr:hypothetical protein XAUC_04060 [Xanthomonas citri pv. aurantifolii str. ICPB 10535]
MSVVLPNAAGARPSAMRVVRVYRQPHPAAYIRAQVHVQTIKRFLLQRRLSRIVGITVELNVAVDGQKRSLSQWHSVCQLGFVGPAVLPQVEDRIPVIGAGGASDRK